MSLFQMATNTTMTTTTMIEMRVLIVKEVMASFEERNNDDKEEVLYFGSNVGILWDSCFFVFYRVMFLRKSVLTLVIPTFEIF